MPALVPDDLNIMNKESNPLLVPASAPADLNNVDLNISNKNASNTPLVPALAPDDPNIMNKENNTPSVPALAPDDLENSANAQNHNAKSSPWLWPGNGPGKEPPAPWRLASESGAFLN